MSCANGYFSISQFYRFSPLPTVQSYRLNLAWEATVCYRLVLIVIAPSLEVQKNHTFHYFIDHTLYQSCNLFCTPERFYIVPSYLQLPRTLFTVLVLASTSNSITNEFQIDKIGCEVNVAFNHCCQHKLDN